MNNLTIAFVGDAQVGKTSFIKRHADKIFLSEYYPTLKFSESKLKFNTSIGDVTATVLDFGKDLKCLQQEIHRADGVVIMFDGQSTFDSIPKWIDVIGNVPFIICLNKMDTLAAKDFYSQNCQYPFDADQLVYPVSARSLVNFEKPFLFLMQKIFKKPSLSILSK